VEMLSSYQEEVRVVLEATPNTINSSVDNAFTITLTDPGIAYRYIMNTANAKTLLTASGDLSFSIHFFNVNGSCYLPVLSKIPKAINTPEHVFPLN